MCIRSLLLEMRAVWPFPTGLGSDEAFGSELRGSSTTTHLLKLFDP